MSRSASFLAIATLLAAGSVAYAQSRNGIESAPLLPPASVGQPPAAAPSQSARPQYPQLPPPGAPRTAQPGAQLPPPSGQQQPPAAPQTPVTTPPVAPGSQAPAGDSNDYVVVQPSAERISNPTAVYAGLDKITGRITSFEAAIGETVQFGALQVTPRVCYTRPPTETPNTTSFTEVNEITLKGEAKRIFTGWMFASSPGLHAVEHPIYDVWLIDCKATPPGTAKSAGQK
ncbi:DUF2155 domain-containing protein [Aquabacter sp. L1I39]|uniref:DUF2155 domain-containing protein n=1 Tax=Aquabacter sp. L1I39 TaxID=2820278 RepID=UPI0031598066